MDGLDLPRVFEVENLGKDESLLSVPFLCVNWGVVKNRPKIIEFIQRNAAEQRACCLKYSKCKPDLR